MPPREVLMALHVLLQTISLVALLVTLIITMQMDDLPSSTAFNIMVTAVLFVVLGYLIELIYTTDQAQLIGRSLQLIGIMFAYPLNLYATLVHQKRRLPVAGTILLFIVPLLSVIPLVMYREGQLLSFDVLWKDNLTAPVGNNTPYLLLYYGYPTLCLLANCVLLFMFAVLKNNRERAYSIIFLFTNLLPPAMALVYYLGWMDSFNPYSMLLALCCVATGVATLPSRVGNWASYARELALQQSKEGYLLLDANNRYVECNGFVKNLFPVLQTIYGAVPISHLPELQQLVAHTTGLRPGQTSTYTVENTLLRVSRMQVEYGGKYMGVCVQLCDETEIRNLQADITKIETTNYMTGFLNERTFLRVAERDFHIALRIQAPASIIALSIDGLEDIRAGFGDDCHTYATQSVALMLRARLRKTDLIGFADNGSFLIFLPASSEGDSFDIAEGCRLAVESGQYDCNGIPLHLTASVGISSLDPKRHIDTERIVTEARAAMYMAQNTGGNRTCRGGPQNMPNTLQ